MLTAMDEEVIEQDDISPRAAQTSSEVMYYRQPQNPTSRVRDSEFDDCWRSVPESD
jgi:hypothetical protein